ncbi:MAG: DegT/DnrJ/EryC1/StrS family aminotransferase [Planctomycetaceae bacterium]
MKQRVEQLAIFGGRPLFETGRHVGQPNLPDTSHLLRRIQSVMDSGWLTNNGPQVRAFESRVCDMLKVRHCIAVCNGTTAIQIMARACNLTGEVIVPSMTFIATPHALEWIGLKPIFADVDPVTHTLDPDSVVAAITARTTAILGVHVWGNPCHTDRLQAIADTHRLRLLFDSSHAFGCRINGRSLGTFGDAEAFSFHATKIAHTLEGGVITTNSDELADRCRRLRNFGITGLTEIDDAGINGKLSEVAAAVGLTILDVFPSLVCQNAANAETYRTALRDCRGIRLAASTADDGGNSQYAVATVDESEFGLSRNELVAILRAEGAFARSYFSPGCHRAAPYRDDMSHCPVPLPVTELLLQSVLQFPTGRAVDQQDIWKIAHVVRFTERNSAEIRTRLTASGALQYSHADDPAHQAPQRREAA